MSDKRASQPDVDSPLRDELAKCESLLASMPLPVSRVDRDELMYRAGWAAAQTQDPTVATNRESSQQVGNKSARMTFAWSCASALVAASLTALITLQRPSTIDPSSSPPTSVVGRPEPAIASIQLESPLVSPREPSTYRPRWPQRELWNASLLNMRERALRGAWDDFQSETQNSIADLQFGDSSSSRSKTARELLREFTSPQS